MLNTIFSGITAASFVLMIIQIRLLKQQMRIEHERQKRINTITIMNHWIESFLPDTGAIWHFVSKLSSDECAKIREFKTFPVTRDAKDYLNGVCILTCHKDEATCSKCRAESSICQEQVLHIRYVMNHYLNNLETVFSAWKLDVVDKNTVEIEFSDLYSPIERHDILENYRIANGGAETYPNINEFYYYLKKKKEPVNDPSPIKL